MTDQEFIVHYCKKLRLGVSIVNNYKDINVASNEEFLAKLLKLEFERREVVRKNRVIKTANFDIIKTFENYSFDEIEIPSNLTVGNIKAVKFIDKKENLILYGNVGTEKIHMACSWY